MKHIPDGLDSAISLCLPLKQSNKPKPAFYRIADYDRENDELAPALTDYDVDDPEEKEYYPRSLYSPSAEALYDSGADDFLYFEWTYDEYGPHKHPVITHLDDPRLGRIPEPHEVIFLNYGRGADDLRNALSTEGIPLQGGITHRFYIVYDERDGHYIAIDCNIRDFVVANNRIMLSRQNDNVRNSALSAPVVHLEDSLLIYPPFNWLPQRSVYSDLGELEHHGSIPLRDLDYYASDYIKWFARETESNLSRADERALMSIVQSALAIPDYLERYLNAPAPDIELKKLQYKVRSLAEKLLPEDVARVGQALFSDKRIHQKCLEEFKKASDEEVTRIKQGIQRKQEELEVATIKCQELEDEVRTRSEELNRIEHQIEAAKKTLDDEMDAYESFMQEIESNVAFKLGLRTIASQLPEEKNSNSTSGSIAYNACEDLGLDPTDCKLHVAIAHNLIRLGVASFNDIQGECLLLAIGTLSCLPYTKFICCPNPIAQALADSIAIALSGKTACRAHVPSDYRNAAEVFTVIDSSDSPVVLIDNIIDPLNEGILSAIINRGARRVVVLPFTSHSSVRLLARELWSRLFFAPAESLILTPGENGAKRCRRSDCVEIPLPQSLDDIKEDGADLAEVLQGINLPIGSRLLASAVYTTALQLCEDQQGAFAIAKRTITQHLGVSSADNPSSITRIKTFSQDDSGLSLLERALYVE